MKIIKAMQPIMVFRFQTQQTEFAIKVLHDETGDGQVSKNWTGVYPKEGLGFSNGQKVSLLGPPKYQRSKVSLQQFEGEMDISLVYP